MGWLRQLNPLVVLTDYWRERDRLHSIDRSEDRAAQAALVNGMQAVVMKSLETSQQNTALFERFLKTYDIAEPPQLRVFDEDEDDKRYVKRKQSSTPFENLGRDEQFAALLKNLERFEAGD